MKYFFLSAAIGLAGCASVQGYPDRFQENKPILEQLKSRYGVEVALKEYERLGGEPELQKAYRNEVIAAHLMGMDVQFAHFQRSMFSQRTTLRVGGDIAKSAFSAAGALTTAGQTSQVLSGLTGAFDMGTESADKNIYAQQTQVAVMSIMIAERAKVRTRIQKSLELSTTDYPLAFALSDLEEYFLAGSIPGALTSIASTAGEKQAAADKELKAAVTQKVNKAFAEPDAVTRAEDLVEMVDSLSPEAALEILKQLEPELDQESQARLNMLRRNFGQDFDQNGWTPKNALKAAFGNMSDRSEGTVGKWKDVIQAKK